MLDAIDVRGDVSWRRLYVTGEVRAQGAVIGGQLVLSGATLRHQEGDALSLQGSKVGGLWLRDVKKVEGRVDLTACQVGDLYVGTADHRAVPPGRLVADGWRIGAVHGAMAADAGAAQDWLDTRPADLTYSPQPARALAEVYERAGHPAQARRLRYTAARRVAARAPGWAKPWYLAYGGLVGHGYYPLRTLGWIVVFLLLAAAVTTTQAGAFEPTDPAQAVEAAKEAAPAGSTAPALEDLTGATPCRELGTYPCFAPWPYALQTVVPPAAALQTTEWQPTGWVLLGITALRAAGWVLVALFLAGITGLLRRT